MMFIVHTEETYHTPPYRSCRVKQDDPQTTQPYRKKILHKYLKGTVPTLYIYALILRMRQFPFFQLRVEPFSSFWGHLLPKF